MREVTGDLWKFAEQGFAEVLCITTNGDVRSGRCVMGQGCAKEARDMFPGIDRELGRLINAHGSQTFDLGQWVHGPTITIVAMPVKIHYWQPARLDLIEESARQLRLMADHSGWQSIIMPRPGCGPKTGQLRWENVRPVLAKILDDRFTATTFDSK
jgi:hypothetical protein